MHLKTLFFFKRSTEPSRDKQKTIDSYRANYNMVQSARYSTKKEDDEEVQADDEKTTIMALQISNVRSSKRCFIHATLDNKHVQLLAETDSPITAILQILVGCNWPNGSP